MSRAILASLCSEAMRSQVNLIDPEILFWRPAEEILPAIVGPGLVGCAEVLLKQWQCQK